MRVNHLLTAIILLTLSFNAFANTSSQILENVSPVVISTYPKAGDKQVDSSISEIKVIFSKEMKTANMWSVMQFDKATFPKITGKVHYLADARTFIIPVKLAKNKAYVLGLNSHTKTNFKGKNDKAALPYILSFKTK